MAAITVRAYNTRFGDAILVTVPDRRASRHLLIDFGNSLEAAKSQGGRNDVFLPIFKDIVGVTGGHIDLYVMTHEHLDHVQGLYYIKQKYKRELTIDHAWLTWAAEPNARRALEVAHKAFQTLVAQAASLDLSGLPWVEHMMSMNNPQATDDCVEYLRTVATEMTYINCETNIAGTHPLREASLRVLAPEKDISVYSRSVRAAMVPETREAGDGPDTDPEPLPGVDGGSFYRLVDSMRQGLLESLFAINSAVNNTSVVFTLEWRGRRLLFTGDAELASWRRMAARRPAMLHPVDFLKVGHHGSRNATPQDAVLDVILPRDGAKRTAVLSTWDNTHSGVPDPRTLERLRARAHLYDTRQVKPGKPVTIEIPEAGRRR